MSVKQCATCKAEVADDRAVCPECGGQWLEDGSSEPPWRLEMERLKARRESKVRRAEGFNRITRPIAELFMTGGGCCLVPAAILTLAPAVALAVVGSRAAGRGGHRRS